MWRFWLGEDQTEVHGKTFPLGWISVLKHLFIKWIYFSSCALHHKVLRMYVWRGAWSLNSGVSIWHCFDSLFMVGVPFIIFMHDVFFSVLDILIRVIAYTIEYSDLQVMNITVFKCLWVSSIPVVPQIRRSLRKDHYGVANILPYLICFSSVLNSQVLIGTMTKKQKFYGLDMYACIFSFIFRFKSLR